MFQKEKRNEARPWLIVGDETMVKYASWKHFVQDFCRPTVSNTGGPSANGKYPIERLIGLMHWGAKIECLTSAEKLERILFYLHFADQYYKYSEHGEKLLNALGTSAYNNLLGSVLEEFFGSIKDCWFWDNRTHKNVPLMMEVSEAILKFFTGKAKNIPQKPHHKKTVDHVLLMIRSLVAHPGPEHIIEKAHVKEMGLTIEFLRDLNRRAVDALVFCDLYENVIKLKIFAAMEPLKQKVNNPIFDLIVRVLEQKQKIESMDDILKWLQVTLLLQDQTNVIGEPSIGKAGIVWLKLWALQVNPEADIRGWSEFLEQNS
jgi:hypothetical protein